MPFRNVSGNIEDDYIADGIGLGIQTLLVQLSGLFLINALTEQAYRDGKVTAAEAIKDLPVNYALEGAVQRAGQRVRVTVQLTDLKENAVVWADRYDNDLDDVFELQDSVTREVISALSKEILRGQITRIWSQDLSGHGAWEYFLRGVSHFYKYTKEDSARAREMFMKLYELFPEKTLGPGYIALTHWVDAARGWSDSPSDSIAQAEIWAEKASRSDEHSDGLGHVIMGSIRLRQGKHEEALALCRKGVAFRASCPFALGQLAAVQNYCGDALGAVKSAREALTVRRNYPPPVLNILATAYRDCGEIGFSIPAAREAVRLDPENTDALATLCSDHVLNGDIETAHAIADEIVRNDPTFATSEYAKRHPYKNTGKLVEILDALRDAGLPE
jgi:TolB-like protein